MDATAELAEIIPAVVELFRNNDHEIGESYIDIDEDGDYGRYEDYADNYFSYEDKGWTIEVCYECCGERHFDPGDYWTPPCDDLVNAWGRLTEINVAYLDEETGEETEFSDSDLKELREALEKELLELV